MLSFRTLSIPKKIVTLTMVVTGAALLLASAALVAYDLNATRKDLEDRAILFSRIVADNTNAAVSFKDVSDARDILNSLRSEPSIVAACIYTPEGLFAGYARDDSFRCSQHPAEKAGDGMILAATPIELSGETLGTVQLHATLAPAYAHFRLEVLTIAAVLVFAGLFAFALSSRLHRWISQPILNLAKTARAVSREKDYSIRAAKENEDELGSLVDAFNEMLAQIQKRDRDLQERTSELLQASRMKDEFLATLSHELRTPLNSILGWAVLVRDGNLPSGRERAAMEAIERNARMQARLIEDLLDVSRIISGKFTLDPSTIELQDIIENAIDVVRPAAEAKQIRIEFARPQSAVRVVADAARLQQTIWNLLSNAVKFTQDHGNVVVRLEILDHYARIAVADNGVGIPREFLPYVFDRFRQVDGSSTRQHGGLGLGLAIVRHIVEMHGGSVSVESQGAGKGTTFTIQLPLAPAQTTSEWFRPGLAR